MDLGTVIIGALMLAVFMAPFILFNRNRTNKEKIIEKLLFNLAEKVNSDITEFTQWDNTAIGLSTTSKKLFFYRKLEHSEINYSIDFQSIQRCKITNISRKLKSNNENYEIIDRLELNISTSNRNKQEIILEFYNSEINGQMEGELLLIKEWDKKINSLIIVRKQSA